VRGSNGADPFRFPVVDDDLVPVAVEDVVVVEGRLNGERLLIGVLRGDVHAKEMCEAEKQFSFAAMRP
jgi:hypothetical protein